MSVVTLFSAKGAPGVTTLAALLAAMWPQPALLADCDLDGGDVSLRLLREDGLPVDADRGLLSLLPLARRAMDPDVLHDHAQLLQGGTPLLAGLSGPEQAEAVGPLWPALAAAFADLSGADVVVDAGRVNARSAHLPLLLRSSVAVIVVRTGVSDVVAARARLLALESFLRPVDRPGPEVGVVVVAPPADRRDVVGAVATLRSASPWLHDLGHLALDPRGAAMFQGESVLRPERTLLVRSGAAVLSATASLSARARSSLGDRRSADGPAGPVVPATAP